MIRAILVDDERLSLDKLSMMLKESGLVEVVGEYQIPSDAFDAVSNDACDVVFLDIHMPRLDGLELADKLLQVNSDVTVVFVTAYDAYAIDAFELSALDYLLKPVKRERLRMTLERITKLGRVPKDQNRLQVSCLGGFRVSIDSVDRNDMNWRTSKAEELFAFLIHQKDVPVRRDDIIDQVWIEFDHEKAVSHFHTTLYYVRKTLATSGIVDVIQQDKSFYRLDLARIQCDYYVFDSLLNTLPSWKADADIPLLEHFVDAYQGKYMGELSYAWAEQTRIHVEQSYVQALTHLCDLYEGRGEYAAAEARLRQVLRHYPLSERIHERLISVYLLQRDRMAALKQYDSLRRKLKAEFGVEPWTSVKGLLGIR